MLRPHREVDIQGVRYRVQEISRRTHAVTFVSVSNRKVVSYSRRQITEMIKKGRLVLVRH